MKELIDAIERVRERIKKYEDKLKQNEMLTRYVLVDPILCALGWDTENPDQVEPEFQTEVGRPDYILRWNNICIGVEAKKLGASDKIFDEAYRKALPLWQSLGIRYYVITDGDRWILWDISKPRTQNPEPIIHIRLTKQNPGDSVRQLLALWRSATPELKPAPKSVVDIYHHNTEYNPISTSEELLSLKKLSEKIRYGQEPPKYIQFPDGEQKEINSWRNLLIEVAKWALPKLQEKNKLPLDKLIRKGKMRRYRYEKLSGGWKVSTNFSSKNCVRNAIRILKEAGISADEVFVINKDKIKK
jgi:hypothetical protein